MTVLSPEPGRIAPVRQRRYLVENVTPPPSPDEALLVDLSCLDDDARGEPLTVLWEHEPVARILEDDGWFAVADKGCLEGSLRPGDVWVSPSGQPEPRRIVQFPTERHWRDRSFLPVSTRTRAISSSPSAIAACAPSPSRRSVAAWAG